LLVFGLPAAVLALGGLVALRVGRRRQARDDPDEPSA
jgi:hypothetical protein